MFPSCPKLKGYPDRFMSRYHLTYPPKIVKKDLDKIFHNCIWRSNPPYLQKDILSYTQEQGGFEVEIIGLDSEVYLKQNSIWNAFPKYLLDCWCLEFLLRCNFDVDKIPVKLAKFYKQALLAWMLAYKHTFPPHRYFLWNNKYIQFV
jgi:hypothetical protein